MKVSVNGAVVLDEDEKALHELDKLQSNPACAEQEQEGLKKRHKPVWKLTYEPRVLMMAGWSSTAWRSSARRAQMGSVRWL